jgi:hypothetical protein
MTDDMHFVTLILRIEEKLKRIRRAPDEAL